MDGELLDPQQRLVARSFRIEDGAMVFCDANRKSSRIGSLVLTVDWSHRKGPSGLVVISHPSWETLPRIVLLAGTSTKDGGLRWRFFCPITRKLVQVVYFDKESQLFVTHAALGRPQRKSDCQRMFQYLGQTLDLQEKYGDLSEKPAGMSDNKFHLLKEVVEDLEFLFLLAAGGVANPVFRNDSWFDILAMLPSPIEKPGKTHYRDKAGVLRLSVRSKKRLGIV